MTPNLEECQSPGQMWLPDCRGVSVCCVCVFPYVNTWMIAVFLAFLILQVSRENEFIPGPPNGTILLVALHCRKTEGHSVIMKTVLSGIHRKGSEEEQVPPWLEEIGLLYWILNHEGVQVLKEGWKRLRLWGDRKRRQLERKRLVKPHKGMSMNLFIFIIFNLFGVCVVCVHACHRTKGRRQPSSLFEKGSLCCSPLCMSGQLAGPWASRKTRCYCAWLYVGSESSISLSKQVLYFVCCLSKPISWLLSKKEKFMCVCGHQTCVWTPNMCVCLCVCVRDRKIDR